MKIDSLKAAKAKLEKDNGDEAQAKVKALEAEIEATIQSEMEFRQKEAELEAYAKAHPKWDVDNISKVRFVFQHAGGSAGSARWRVDGPAVETVHGGLAWPYLTALLLPAPPVFVPQPPRRRTRTRGRSLTRWLSQRARWR